MILKQIILTRNEWGDNKGLLMGHVTFAGDNGEIKLMVTSTQAEKFLAVFAEALVESAKEVANKLTAEMIVDERLLK